MSVHDVISSFLEDPSMDPNEVLQHMKDEVDRSPKNETEGSIIPITDDASILPSGQSGHSAYRQMTPLAWAETQAMFLPDKQSANSIAFAIHENLLSWVAYYNEKFYWRNEKVFDQITEEKLKQKIFGISYDHLWNGKGTRFLSEIVNLIRVDPRFVPEALEDNAKCVHFPNGTYDIESHRLIETDPRAFFTVYIPIQFLEGTECKTFDKFLDDVTLGNPILKERILEVIGYLIVPGDLSAKAWFLFAGVGNSGKSVLAALVSSMFTSSSVANLSLDRFESNFSTSALKGKYLNVCADLPSTPLSRNVVATIKQLTGVVDTITVEEKYKTAESLKPTAKLLFCSNFQLKIRNPDLAFMDRMVTIPFVNAVPREHQDHELLNKMLNERSAIVVKALDAYLRLRSNNYIFAGQEYIDNMLSVVGGTDLLRSFVETRCVLDSGVYSYTEDLLNAYADFCAEQGSDPGVTKKRFSQDLALLCGEKIWRQKRSINDQSRHGFWGIRVK